MDDQLFQLIKSDMDEMKKDIKTLLAFRWKIYGVNAAITLIVAALFQVALAWAAK